jgi:hypothetical protein
MMSDDDRIKEINERVKEIDEQLDRLRVLKSKLLKEKEKLTDKKNYEKSENLSKTEWQNGECFESLSLGYIKHVNNI